MIETDEGIERNDYSKDGSGNVLATLIGTLPPLKGISQYCGGLFSELKNIGPFEFITFSKLYPQFLYPGGNDKDGHVGTNSDYYSIHGYDPRTWIYAGLNIKGRVVHAQWWSFPLFPAFYSILLLSKIRSKKIVITIHNVTPHENRLLGKISTKILLKIANKIIVHSNANKISLIEAYPKINSSDVAVIPHGILSPPGPAYTLDSARQKLGIPSSSHVVLFFGNIRPYKGLDMLLIAINLARTRISNLHLIIAGKSWQDWNLYEQQIDKLGLRDITTIRNEFIPSEEIGLYFASADLVVLPYKNFDAQSGVGLTALNYGKPLMVTKEGGMSDLVSDDIALLSPNDPIQLSEKIIRVFLEPDLLRKMANDSVIIARQFQWSSIAQATLELYNEIKGD